MIITFIAITWPILIGAAYEEVCDGPYINSVEKEKQLSFTNIRYIERFLGEAIGVFFCGFLNQFKNLKLVLVNHGESRTKNIFAELIVEEV